MKKLLLLVFIFSSGLVLAQTNKEDIEIIQSVFGKEKKTLVASFVQLNPANSDAFWKLYDEYETSRKQLGVKRVQLLEKYVNSYNDIDDATTDQIMKEMQSLQVQTDKLIVTYYGKMKKVAGSKAAAQFYQLEGYLLTMVRATILENIPFLGELDEKW